MQILDGKNHQRGAYERIALDRILRVLNTGRHWGYLDLPMAAESYTQETICRANETFLTTLRAFVDQWIESGISEDGTETPSSRYVRGLPKGYSESLFDILHDWLGRNMPKTVLMTEGRFGIVDQQPQLRGLELETYARETAIFYLKELLECPAPHRLGRCKNPACRTYFVRKREYKGVIKRGTYCGNCELMGAAERTRQSRQRRKEQQLDAAAKAWPLWKRSNRHRNRAEWIAAQVNKQVGSAARIQAKWVTQNREAILARL